MSARWIAVVLAVSGLLVAGCGSTSLLRSKSQSSSSTGAAGATATATGTGTAGRPATAAGSASAAGASTSRSTTAHPPTATSIDGSFETVVPTGFIDATRSVKSGVANVQYLAIGPRARGFTTNINVIREPAQGATGIAAIVGLEIATIKRIEPRADHFSRSSKLTVGGATARAVDYFNRASGDRTLHQRQVFVGHGGWIYTITLSASPAAYAADVGAINEVTAAWEWLGLRRSS
jgi:hypothetical protein